MSEGLSLSSGKYNEIVAQSTIHESDSSTVITEPIIELKEPSLYRVLLHNDDFTPMEFVVSILEGYFNMDHSKAQKVMLDVHTKGVGQCGIFPYQIAETKVAVVADQARMNEFPLLCTMEKDE